MTKNETSATQNQTLDDHEKTEQQYEATSFLKSTRSDSSTGGKNYCQVRKIDYQGEVNSLYFVTVNTKKNWSDEENRNIGVHVEVEMHCSLIAFIMKNITKDQRMYKCLSFLEQESISSK